jgi:diguanylate cyclase
MSSEPEKAGDVPHTEGALTRALDQSEQIQDKVEQAAADLSEVNEVLKDEIAGGVPLSKVELALDQTEAIEAKVQEAADELVAVNDALAKEIDERRELEGRLLQSDAALVKSRAEGRRSRHNALHDAITGLPNLTLFNDRLTTALAQAQRHGWRLAVMFIDLDDFKSVNDTHGHDVGDRVLQIVAKRLRDVVRSGDTVSRRGGDEFLFLMLEAKDEANATELATRIGGTIAEICDIDGLKFTVKASVGIALYPEDGVSGADLLKHADMAMYRSKEQKNGSVLYSQVPPA